MEKFSVKKPFTVLVGILMIIALGMVSVFRVSTDLLPNFSLPYLMVIAPYPGASPERVERSVIEPMENALGTITGVKNISSWSYENYGMLQMEFEDGTNMDSSIVRISSALDQLRGNLPDAVSTPSIIELSMDMLATMYVAINREGYDIYALSDFVQSDIVPYIERQEGVASVNAIGLVERSIQVDLNRNKINDLNDRILEETDKALADAKEALDKAQKEVEDGKKLLEEQEAQFGSTLSGTVFDQIDDVAIGATNATIGAINDLIMRLNELNASAASYTVPEEVQALAESEELERLQKELDRVRNEISDPEEQRKAEETLQQAIAALQQAQQAPGGAQITSAEEIEAARRMLEEATSALAAVGTQISATGDVAASLAQLSSALAQIQTALQTLASADLSGQLSTQIEQSSASLAALGASLQSVPSTLDGLAAGYAGLTQAQLDAAVGFATAKTQLELAEAQLKEAQTQYENGRETARKNASADELISPSTLSQLIYAQNFEMPAGYLDDRYDESWLLRIGQEYEDAAEISDILLLENDTLGSVRLTDVADVTVIDNAGESYANLNGSDGLILSIYKSPTSGTNAVSRTCRAAFADLEERFNGVRIVPMMDQGIYITFIIKDILSSMLLGAILAILVLAFFLRTVRPTLVVAISIPLSVLFTLVLMYFTDLSLNMMTLSGLALGIGMLVDNSIVVMENIFRLRGRGLSSPRAAVQGAKQVRSAITASTLTTICVFLPIIFASGTVRQFMLPLALTIGYCLTASLIVSLTVVPAASSTILKKTQPKEIRFFTGLQNAYGRSLRWCLRHKLIALGTAVLLLVLSIWQVLRMGIVFLPEMTSNFIEVDITTPNAETREESYALMDETVDRILTVDGMLDFGIMDESSTAGLISAYAPAEGSYGSYIGYLTAPENASPSEIYRICEDVQKATEDLDVNVRAYASSMADMSGFTSGGGLTLTLYGQDMDTLREIAADTKALVEKTPGFKDVKDGSEKGAPTLHLIVDRDKAMTYGLTVAQIYAEIAARTETKVTSTSITVDGMEMDVAILDETDPLTKENLLRMTFKTNAPDMAQMSGEEDLSNFSSMSLGDLFGGEDDDADDATDNDSSDAKDKSKSNKDEIPETIRLGDIATLEETTSLPSITRENMAHTLTVTAGIEDGENITLLSRDLEPALEEFRQTLPRGYSIEFSGQTSQITDMLGQMFRMLLLALLFIYLIMVAQFQSLMSPFIVMFTIPLAFTGGMIGLLVSRQQLTLLALMGFLVLMGTVVNNGIVFVDYTNQLRMGGLERREALVAAGKTRMRPILMTALTTILAMGKLIFGSGMGSQLGSGMAVVIAGGLIYATFMTLYSIPLIYDIFFRRAPLNVDIGDDLEDAPDDAADYLRSLEAEKASAKSPE